MFSKYSLATVVVASLFASPIFARITWVPINPIIIGPPVITPVPINPVHTVTAGRLFSVLVPHTIQFDDFGRPVSQFANISHFEIVVGPGSSARGCRPAARNEGFASFTGVNSPWPNILPTQLSQTYQRRVPGDRQPWTVYEFAVNGGSPTPVNQINVFFPGNHGPVPCMFQVNTSSGYGNSFPMPADRAGEAEGVARQLAAPAAAAAADPAEKLKLPKVESIEVLKNDPEPKG